MNCFTCLICLKMMKDNKQPKFAVTNGFVIHHISDSLRVKDTSCDS